MIGRRAVAGRGGTAAEVARRGLPAAQRPLERIHRAGTLAGLDPEELAARYGTPLYVYDLDAVTGRVEALRACLPDRLDLAYACKANPALGVVAHLASLDLGADVASEGELETALLAGMRRERIVLTGPGKPDALLRRAVQAGLRAVTIESPVEFERLERITAQEGTRTPILLRLAIGEVSLAGRGLAGGAEGPGKFGMSWGDVRRVAHEATRSRYVELLGLHAFGASNVLDADALAAHVAATVEHAGLLGTEAGFRPRLVDVGGGLGIPYADGERPLDLERLAERLRELATGWSADPLLSETRVLLEPGRFLVGAAGAYLTRVVDLKTLGGRRVAIVDGGIHHLLRPALIGREHRLRLIPRDGRAHESPDGPDLPVTVAGPLCTGLDVFAQAAEIGAPEPGDLLAVLDAGAYGFTESMPYFLSHATPAEVAVRGGEARLLRPRLDPLEVLARQRMPRW